MGFLPNVIQDNSSNISIKEISSFKGYNHNAVIADNEFYDMLNVCGNDYPALSVRPGRSEYTEWNISVKKLKSYYNFELTKLTLEWIATAATHGLFVFKEWLVYKDKTQYLSFDSYLEYEKNGKWKNFETYCNGTFNGAIDYDGFLIVKGGYVHYDGNIICKMSDCKKVLCPLGGKIAVFPDKKIINMDAVIKRRNGIINFLSANLTENNIDAYVNATIDYYRDTISDMDYSSEYENCSEMTHYSVSGRTVEIIELNDDFSGVAYSSETDTTEPNNPVTIALSDSWKAVYKGGKNSVTTFKNDNCYGSCLIHEITDASVIYGIYAPVEYNYTDEDVEQIKIRFSFYAKADRSDVTIRPYISLDTIDINKSTAINLDTEWKKITIEKTIDVSNIKSGSFAVSFDGTAVGSSRKVWFSQPEIESILPQSISDGLKVFDAVHLKVEFTADGQTYEAEHDAVIYDISKDGSILTFSDYSLLAMFPENMVYYEQQADGTELAVPSATSISLTNLKISKTAPDIDYACTCHNKIFGVNTRENVIYACYSDDPSNWNFFEGISKDSFYAESTTPGRWTGAITHNGYPIFFKEQYLAIVYGSDSTDFYVIEKKTRGLQAGSERSLVILNDTLFYKSYDGIMFLNGTIPYCISEAFGSNQYHSAVFGAGKNKLYVSMLDSNNTPALFVWDMNTSCWYKEDPIRAAAFVFADEKMRLIEESTGDVITMQDNDTSERVKWFIETGDLYDNTSYKKYIWKIILRIDLAAGSNVKVLIRYDSEGQWEELKILKNTSKKVQVVPLACRRSDHLNLRLEGEGKATLYSISRRFIVGSEL